MNGTERHPITSLDEQPLRLQVAATLDVEELVRRMRTRPDGLSTEEAAGILRLVGPNRLPRSAPPGLAAKLVSQFTHFFALMLWAAAVLAMVGGLPQLAIAIVLVIVVNGIFSFAQEERATKAAAALSDLMPTFANVVRDGRPTRLDAVDLVPGDVVQVREGDRVSADARVMVADGLLVDTSTLTGESVPVSRTEQVLAAEPEPLSSATNLVFAGTHVVAGSGSALVLRTGADTLLGGIARMTGEVVRRPTPLQLDLHRTVKMIATFAIAAGGIFFGAATLLGTSVRDGFLFAVGVIVALVPEGLLPTVTLALAMSAMRMAGRGALVRRSEAVETLGATTVICSDKTGTMTTNQMTVRVVVAGSQRISTTGLGWGPGGALLVGSRPVSEEERRHVQPILRAAALCGDAELQTDEGTWRCVGDPTEGALIALARKGGVEREEESRRSPRIRAFPFDSVRMRMSTLHALSDGSLELIVKGAPESILRECSQELTKDGAHTIGPERMAGLLDQVDALSSDGLRVLALASRVLGSPPASSGDAERSLTLLGLVGLEDPVRPEVPAAVQRCRDAGIRVLMVTGDHPHTAASVAKAVGIAGDAVLLGSSLPSGGPKLKMHWPTLTWAWSHVSSLLRS